MRRARVNRFAATIVLTAAALLILTAALPRTAHIRPSALVRLIALEQDWRMFAPVPRKEGVRIQVLVEWSDGHRTAWRIPSSGSLLGQYRDYRWRKWAEYAASDEIGPWLWRPLARFTIQRLPARLPARPTRLRIIRHTRAVSLPGADESAWSTTELYRAELGPAT